MTNVPKTLFDIQIKIAVEVNGEIRNDIVGRAEGLTFTRNQTLQHKHEAANRNPYAIQRLGVEPQGTLIRAWGDNDLIKTLIDYKDGNNPSFTLEGIDKIDNEVWIVEGAVIGNSTHNFTFDNGEENYEFYALKIKPAGSDL